MITLYRAPYKFGRSIDTKPTDVENGASYIDEGNDYIWINFAEEFG